MKSSFHGVVDAVAEAVEIKDPQTAGHQRRVAQLAVAIAREMDFSLNRLEGIRVAGLLHDIGKIAVPMEILSKPGELTNLECEFIKSHCQIGFDLLKNIDFPWPVLQAILQHHERLDGSGYPAGLTDKEIILEARILGVADVVEAMVSARSYGPAQGIGQALEEIHQKSGILYDPEVANICLKLNGGIQLTPVTTTSCVMAEIGLSLSMNLALTKELADAEAKAIDSLARYKFAMFGYWAGIWVHLNRISGMNLPNPFKDLVKLAKKLREHKGNEN